MSEEAVAKEAAQRSSWSTTAPTDDTAAIAAPFPCRVWSARRSGEKPPPSTPASPPPQATSSWSSTPTPSSPPSFLGAIGPHFADPTVGAVAGNVKVGNRRYLLARLQALEYIVSLNLDRRAQAQLNVMSVVPGAAGAFRRRALLDAGGYPTDTLVEDADLTFTLRPPAGASPTSRAQWPGPRHRSGCGP